MATINYDQLADLARRLMACGVDGMNAEVKLTPDDGSPALILSVVQDEDLSRWVGLPDEDDTLAVTTSLRTDGPSDSPT